MAVVKVIRKKHKKLEGNFKGPKRVKVGFPAGAVGGEILNIAVWNHFGTGGGGWGGPIPERPFLSNAIRDNQGSYKAALKSTAAQILMGDATMGATLGKLGVLAQGHIQGEITALSSPPNSPVTIKIKGSSNPLIDRGAMRGAVTWKLDDD